MVPAVPRLVCEVVVLANVDGVAVVPAVPRVVTDGLHPKLGALGAHVVGVVAASLRGRRLLEPVGPGRHALLRCDLGLKRLPAAALSARNVLVLASRAAFATRLSR